MPLTRRSMIAGAALLAAPITLRAQDAWVAFGDRAAAFDQLHTVAVRLDGADVLRRRVRGPSDGQIVNVKSVAKTWVVACLGAALDRGDLPALDATLGAVAPSLIPADADPRVSGITLEHLAAMQAGLERTSGGNYGGWIASNNWVADALSREMVAAPGGRMLYSTGSTHVLGAALAEASGLSLLEQMRRRLGDPLGVEIPPWVRDPQGRYLGGNQMGLTLEAMLRFGEMHRMGGVWNGRQVLSQGWIDAAWIRRTQSPWSGLGYGLGWFLGQEAGQPFALARGYGGQLIAVCPGAGLTMAITSDPNQPARSQGYFGDLMELVRDAIRQA